MNETQMWEEMTEPRPKTYGECKKLGLNPCPYIGCKQHMIWIHTKASVLGISNEKLIHDFVEEHTDDEIIEMVENLPETCTLRAAEVEKTLEYIGDLMGVTLERARQICGYNPSKSGIMKYGALSRLKNKKILKEIYYTEETEMSIYTKHEGRTNNVFC